MTGWAKAAWASLSAVADPETPRSLEALDASDISELFTRDVDSLYLKLAGGHPRLEIYAAVWAAQWRLLTSFVAELTRQGIPSLVFKGAGVFARHLRHEPVGMVTDCDLIVPKADSLQAFVTAFQQGFRPTKYSRVDLAPSELSISDIGGILAAHYELPGMSKAVALDLDIAAIDPSLVGWNPLYGEGFLSMELDIHFGLAVDVPGSAWQWDRAVPAGDVQVPCDADHLWFVASRYYGEVASGKRSLRDLAYIAAIMRHGDIDWDLVLRAANDFGLRASLYYPLLVAEQLGALRIPREVVELLSPRTNARLSDHGWQLGKLFDFVEPLWVPTDIAL